MASQSMNPTQKPQYGQIIIGAVCVIILIVGLIVMGRHYFAQSGPTMSQKLDLDKHPLPDWVNKDAVQCQGHIGKLSLSEQQKLYAAYPRGAARTVISAAYLAER